MRPVLDARFDHLSKGQRDSLWEWRRAVEGDDPHKGLWIVQGRGEGSSYIANVAMRRMVLDHEWSWEWFTAEEIIQATRNRWSYDEQIRQHPNDDDLWKEQQRVEEEIDFFWNTAGIICIDDLHSTEDVKFWRKHCQGSLERRIKNGKPTIVATDMPPEYREFSDITRVISNLFVVCDAAR